MLKKKDYISFKGRHKGINYDMEGVVLHVHLNDYHIKGVDKNYGYVEFYLPLDKDGLELRSSYDEFRKTPGYLKTSAARSTAKYNMNYDVHKERAERFEKRMMTKFFTDIYSKTKPVMKDFSLDKDFDASKYEISQYDISEILKKHKIKKKKIKEYSKFYPKVVFFT